MQFARILRLPVNAGLPAMIVKTCGRDLPAGIAIDARGVHEELAFYVLRQPMVDLGHVVLDSARAWRVAFPAYPLDSRGWIPKYLIILAV